MTEYNAYATMVLVTVISAAAVFVLLFRWLRRRVWWVGAWAITSVVTFLYCVVCSALVSFVVYGFVE